MKTWLLLLFSIPCFAQKPQTASVGLQNGHPTLLLNGKPELPFMYALTHVTGGRWSWEELPAHNLRQMASVGVRLYQVDLWLEDIWKSPGAALDIQLVQRQVGGVLAACPGAAVVVRLHVNAPVWWRKGHPEESVLYADGPAADLPVGLPFNHEDGDIFRCDRTSLASERWRKEAGEKVREFCRRLSKTREGKSVIGLHLAGGVYGEWHPWGFIWNEPDISEPMTRAFRLWLKNKYRTDENLQKAWGSTRHNLATATVPDTLERRCCASGFFRDPAKEQRVIDFYQCHNSVIADDIEYFCKTAKQSWGRPLLTGVFYAYSQFGLCRQALNGHGEAERILNSPWVDYLAGPPSYYDGSRKAGGSGLQRAPVQSVLLHGKLWFDEIDNGYLQDKREFDFVRSLPLGDTAYLPIFQRSLWLPMIQGSGLWLYDFGPQRSAGWWDGPMYLKEIRRTIELFRKQYASADFRSAADALVVWDAESFYAVRNVNTPDCDKGLDAAAEELQRCGVALDHVYLFDLDRMDLTPYKAVVFMNAWKITAEHRRMLREKVAQGGRTLIWNYGAGFSDGSNISISGVESLTGVVLKGSNQGKRIHWILGADTVANHEPVDPLFEINDPNATGLARLVRSGETVIGKKQFSTHTAIVATVPLHDSGVFRALLRSAGCHVWSEQEGGGIQVSQNYVLVHSKMEAAQTLRFKNGIEWNESEAGIGAWLLKAGTGKEVWEEISTKR
ncbi:MAG: beta-galactosidase [Saprospiraceae bacterium]|nr:beta-galactosidase [Saprospiraceae bacterium]